MKEIYEMILKEKAKDVPNREYIQFLQQMSDKTEVEHIKEGEYKDRLTATQEYDKWLKNKSNGKN